MFKAKVSCENRETWNSLFHICEFSHMGRGLLPWVTLYPRGPEFLTRWHTFPPCGPVDLLSA